MLRESSDSLRLITHNCRILNRSARPGIYLRGSSRNGGNHRYFFFFGSLFRFVFAMSRNCFSDIDSTICFEAPLRLDFLRSPRLAASAAPPPFAVFSISLAYYFIVTHGAGGPIVRWNIDLERQPLFVKALHRFKECAGGVARLRLVRRSVSTPRSSTRTCTFSHLELTEISFSGPKCDLQREAEFQVDQSQRPKSLAMRKLLNGHRVGCGIEPV